jgi:hypothetical protein
VELFATVRSLIVPAAAAAALWSAAAVAGAALYVDSIPWLHESGFVAAYRSGDASVTFWVTLPRNLWVFGLNIAGVGRLGISTVASVTANGLQAGLMLAQACREGIGLRALAAVTLPHSLELVALALSGLIVIAAALEARVSLPAAQRLRSSAFEIGS